MFAIFLIIVSCSYFILMGYLYCGFTKIPRCTTENNKSNSNGFSILIPFRNEAKNLPKLLNSIRQLNYPDGLFEVIAIDDFSSDGSAAIFNAWRMANGKIPTTLLENLRRTASPKKDALIRAIPIIKNKWIVTTDADCTVKPNWLLALDQFITNSNAEMVVGSVVYKTKNNWFHHFQQLDLMALQSVTIGSFGVKKPFMCNGANFAYTKKLFLDLDGFSGNFKYASGDDVFLLQKAIQKERSKVHFLKSSDFIVTTKPENSLYALFMQRVRWASKTSGYSSLFGKFLAVVVLATNTFWLLALVLVFLGEIEIIYFWMVFGLKYLTDFFVLQQANTYLRNRKFFFPFASALVYPIFCCSVAYYSFFFGFKWKQRKLN